MSDFPHDLKESEVILALTKAINLLAPSFTFGYYDIEDIKQEAYIFGLESLARYDRSRPIENFLYSHIKNRLINFKRDKYHRTDPPCKSCHENIKCTNDDYCDKYRAWKKRNSSKQNLMRPLDIHSICDDKEKNAHSKKSVVDDAHTSECIKLIDLHLSVELRSIYLRIKSGESVSKIKREKLEEEIRRIINGG